MAFTQSGEEEFLNRLTEITEANLTNERFGVSELAREMGMSRSNLHRKVKSVVGTSISQFICQVRLKKAMELLRHSSSTISEIAFDSGFHSVTYFIKCFHDHYGYPPGKVRMNELEGNSSDDLQQHNARKGIGKKRVSLAFLISVIFVFIAAIGLLFIFKPFAARDQPLDKSIAVLPFINDSPEESEMYFINGTMEAILNNLGKIEDLRVVSRTSVEQYRDNPKPISEIAEEMNVSYILEGSGMKHGDNIWLTVQLIDAINDTHIWSESYNKKKEEVFELYSEVAQLVAGELRAVITPEEKQLIEKIPTSSMIAYEFYQKGMEEYWKYFFDKSNEAALQKTEDLYRYAMEYDSTYAKAYVGIAWIYWFKHERDIYRSGKYLDSVQMSLEIALSYDDQLASAFNLRGYYHVQIGEKDKAIEDFNKTLELSPNFRAALHGLASINWTANNYQEAIENFHRAALIDRGPELANSLRHLAFSYFMAGFKDLSNYHSKQALEVDGDSATYYYALARSEYYISNNTSKAIELYKRGYAIDTSNTAILGDLGITYLDIGQYAESLRYIEKKIDRFNALGQSDLYTSLVSGFAYLMNGNRQKAEYYFDQQIKYCGILLKINKNMHGQLAMVYACRGERAKAYESLRILNQKERMYVYVKTNFQDNLFFESIQNDPEFQKIRSELIAKYQAEHERVRKWLEENDML